METSVTPRDLARRSIVGASILFFVPPFTLLIILLVRAEKISGASPYIALAVLLAAPLILACSLIYFNEKTLRRGLMDDRWQPAQLADARTWLARPALRRSFTVASLAIIALMLALLFSTRHGFSGLGGFTYLMILPSTTLARLKQLVAEPTVPSPRLWANSLPLRSDHWGQHLSS